jgi:hypothetical protein
MSRLPLIFAAATAILLAVASFPASGAEPINIGISPPRIYASHLMPGSHLEKEILLSKNCHAKYDVSVSAEGEATAWLTINTSRNFAFENDSVMAPVLAIIDIPQNTGEGIYEGRLNFLIRQAGQQGIAAEIVLPVSIRLNVSDEKYEALSAGNIRVNADGPLRVTMALDNAGNVKDRPSKAEITVYDKFRNSTVYEHVFPESEFAFAPPFTKQDVALIANLKLPEDEYWAHVEIYGPGEMNNKIIKEADVVFRAVNNTVDRPAEPKGHFRKEIITAAAIASSALVLATACRKYRPLLRQQRKQRKSCSSKKEN